MFEGVSIKESPRGTIGVSSIVASASNWSYPLVETASFPDLIASLTILLLHKPVGLLNVFCRDRLALPWFAFWFTNHN